MLSATSSTQKVILRNLGNKQDLELLKSTCELLLYTKNPSLFLEVLKFLLRLDDKDLIKQAVKGCLRFLSASAEIKHTMLVYVFDQLTPDRYDSG